MFQPPESAGAYAVGVAEAEELMEPKDEENDDDVAGDDAGVDAGPFDVELVDEPAPWAGKGRGRGSSSSSISLGGQVRIAEDGGDPLACMMFHCKLFFLSLGGSIYLNLGPLGWQPKVSFQMSKEDIRLVKDISIRVDCICLVLECFVEQTCWVQWFTAATGCYTRHCC